MLSNEGIHLRDYYGEIFGSSPAKPEKQVAPVKAPKRQRKKVVIVPEPLPEPERKPKQRKKVVPVPEPEPKPAPKRRKKVVPEPEPIKAPEPEPIKAPEPVKVPEPEKKKKEATDKQKQHRELFASWAKAKSGKSFAEWVGKSG